jgi:hypothetical protein
MVTGEFPPEYIPTGTTISQKKKTLKALGPFVLISSISLSVFDNYNEKYETKEGHLIEFGLFGSCSFLPRFSWPHPAT